MSTQTETHLLFPTIVQTTDFDDSAALNEKLAAGVAALRKKIPNTKPDDWIGSVYTTLHADIELLNIEPFSALKPLILGEISRYAETLHIQAPIEYLRILDAWLNVYDRNSSQDGHIHQNSVFSGIYYIKAPADCSSVIFHSHETSLMISPPVTEVDELNSTSVAVPALAGRMVIFRSHLRHSVAPNESDQERISLSFNVDIAG